MNRSLFLNPCSVHFLYSSKENEPKETTPSLRNFLPYQAKTALSAPRRYRSCPSELPASILNRGIFDYVNPSDMYKNLLKGVQSSRRVPIAIGKISLA